MIRSDGHALNETRADEIIISTDTDTLDDRLRSYELLVRSVGRG